VDPRVNYCWCYSQVQSIKIDFDFDFELNYSVRSQRWILILNKMSWPGPGGGYLFIYEHVQ
jgi:hypothetical protein